MPTASGMTPGFNELSKTILKGSVNLAGNLHLAKSGPTVEEAVEVNLRLSRATLP